MIYFNISLDVQITSLASVWQRTLLSTFQGGKCLLVLMLILNSYHDLSVSVSPPLNSYQKDECTSTLEMMYRYTNPDLSVIISQYEPFYFNTYIFSCPFPFELDVGEIVTSFCSVDLHTHALASLLIVPSRPEKSRLLTVSSCSSNKDYFNKIL